MPWSEFPFPWVRRQHVEELKSLKSITFDLKINMAKVSDFKGIRKEKGAAAFLQGNQPWE